MITAQKAVGAARRGRRTAVEPLAEGIPKTKKRDWKRLSDGELVAFVKDFMKAEGIKRKSELAKKDCGLYNVLLRRDRESPGIMNRIGFEGASPNWARMSDDELAAYARSLMDKKGIFCKYELESECNCLLQAIRRRERKKPGIMKRIGFAIPKKRWEAMSDEELVAHTQKIMKRDGIQTRTEMYCRHINLYRAILKRERERPGVISRIGFKKKQKKWEAMSDEELVERVKKFMKERGISHKSEFSEAAPGLDKALMSREKKRAGLLKKVGFIGLSKEWRLMSDDELVAYAREFIRTNGIAERWELNRKFCGLYTQLIRRERSNPGIMDRVWPDYHKIAWASMSDEEIISCAKLFAGECGIRDTTGLRFGNLKLYAVLVRRKLIGAVLSDADIPTRVDAINGVIEALESFGDEK